MTRKKQLSLAEMKVGTLMFFSLILLGWLILQQTWGIYWFQDSVRMITYLPDVGGLKPGAPVWLAGIEIGKVLRVTIVPPEVFAANQAVFRQINSLKKQLEALDPKESQSVKVISDIQDRIRDYKLDLRLVEVQMEVDRQYLNRISTDSEVTIESKGLIGDSFIEISAGTYGIPPRKQGDFYLVEGTRRTGFREIMTGANDVMANFGVLSEEFKNITRKINPDKVGSSMAETIQDLQTTLREASTTFSETTGLVKDLHEGKGTFGRMVADPSLYNRLVASIDRLNTIAAQMQEGSGTLGKLIKDPQVYENANSMLRKTDSMMGRIEKGEGTLGKLSKDPALYDSSRRAMDKLAGFVEQVDRGDGTLGKLMKDPSLYNNLNQSTAEITKLIYDLRQDPKKFLTIRFRLF